MPSVLHEALIALFRNRPTLAAELLAGPLGIDVPAFAAVRFESTELGDVVPPEYRADLGLVLDGEDGRSPRSPRQPASTKSGPGSTLTSCSRRSATRRAPPWRNSC